MSTALCAKFTTWLPAVTLLIFSIPCSAGQDHLPSSRGRNLRGINDFNVRGPIEAGVQSQQHVPKEESKPVLLEHLIKQKAKEKTNKNDATEKAHPEPEGGSEEEAGEDTITAKQPNEAPKQALPEEEQGVESTEDDTSAAQIGPEGEEMIRQMIVAEAEDDTPRVVKTPEQEAEEKKEKEDALRDPAGRLEEAQKTLFDEPASRKHGPSSDDLEGEVFHVDEHDFGHASYEEDHSLHATLHHKDEQLDKHVHIVLLITPIIVFSAVAYYFGISAIDLPPSMDMHSPMTDKMFCHLSGWRRRLGRVIENPFVNFTILGCIVIDLICAGIHDTLVNTDYLNPKYSEWKEYMVHRTHTISIYLLMSFLVEQTLHILVFGKMYFYHFWYVMDLCTVYVSLIGETVLNEKYGDMVSFIIMLRLWKVINVVFDIFLASHETAEMHEKIKKKKEKIMKSFGDTVASVGDTVGDTMASVGDRVSSATA